MTSPEKPVLTGAPLNLSAESTLNLARELIKYSGGDLSGAVRDVLSAVDLLNEALASPVGGKEPRLLYKENGNG